MSFDPTKYVAKAGESILSKLTGVNVADIKIAAIGIDQTLGRIGSMFRKADALSGADSLLGNVSSFFDGKDSVTGEVNSARTPTTVEKSVQATVADKKPNDSGSMMFPLDLKDIRITLQFMRYERPAPMVKATPQSTVFIHLPVPRELQEVHTNQVRPIEMGMIGSIVDAVQAQMAGDQGGSMVGTAAGAAPRVATGVAAGASRAVGMSKAAGVLRAASASDTIGAGLSQLTGAALNPNLSVSFHGPNLREYSLSWQFAPHSADESAAIKKIVNEIKKRSLPSMTFEGSAGLLSYPEMVQLTMTPSTMPFKKALIRAVNVDYAPNGIPSFFKGTKEPTFIALSMTFTEIEYFLSEDFGGASGKGLNGGDNVFDTAVNIGKAAGEAIKQTVSDAGELLAPIMGFGEGGEDPAIADTTEDSE